jgi:hypothetical protein
MRAKATRAFGVSLAAAAAFAVLPAPAGAFFELDFSGHVRQDPDSFVGFNVKGTESGKRRVSFFTTAASSTRATTRPPVAPSS